MDGIRLELVPATTALATCADLNDADCPPFISDRAVAGVQAVRPDGRPVAAIVLGGRPEKVSCGRFVALQYGVRRGMRDAHARRVTTMLLSLAPQMLADDIEIRVVVWLKPGRSPDLTASAPAAGWRATDESYFRVASPHQDRTLRKVMAMWGEC